MEPELPLKAPGELGTHPVLGETLQVLKGISSDTLQPAADGRHSSPAR